MIVRAGLRPCPVGKVLLSWQPARDRIGSVDTGRCTGMAHEDVIA